MQTIQPIKASGRYRAIIVASVFNQERLLQGLLRPHSWPTESEASASEDLLSAKMLSREQERDILLMLL